MNLNPDLVRSQVDEIEQSIRSLEQIRALPLQEFLADQDVLGVACYRLLISIEAALSLCYRICGKRTWKVPEGYAECFGLLADHGSIEPALSERLQKMPRFRNLLIHIVLAGRPRARVRIPSVGSPGFLNVFSKGDSLDFALIPDFYGK